MGQAVRRLLTWRMLMKTVSYAMGTFSMVTLLRWTSKPATTLLVVLIWWMLGFATGSDSAKESPPSRH